MFEDDKYTYSGESCFGFVENSGCKDGCDMKKSYDVGEGGGVFEMTELSISKLSSARTNHLECNFYP